MLSVYQKTMLLGVGVRLDTERTLKENVPQCVMESSVVSMPSVSYHQLDQLVLVPKELLVILSQVEVVFLRHALQPFLVLNPYLVYQENVESVVIPSLAVSMLLVMETPINVSVEKVL